MADKELASIRLQDGRPSCPMLALPHPLLVRVLREGGAQARLVCNLFKDTYDLGASVVHLRTHPGLGKCPFWDAPALVQVPRRILQLHGSQLRQLTLHAHRLAQYGTQELVTILLSGSVRLANLQQLTVLSSETKPGPEAGHLAAAFLEPLVGCSALCTLHASSGAMNNEGACALAAALLRATHLIQLQRLDLSEHRCVVRSTLRYDPYPDGIGAAGHAAISDALSRSIHLSSLQELLLRGAGKRGAATQLAAAVLASSHYPCLRSLDLDVCFLEGEADRTLVRALRSALHVSSLQDLRLAGLWALQTDVQALVQALCSEAAPGRPLSALTRLHLACLCTGGGEVLSSAITRNNCFRNLRALRLEDANFEQDDVVALAASLQHLPELRELAVLLVPAAAAGTPLVAAMAASPHLASSLEALDLTGTYKREPNAAAIAAALRSGAGAGLRSLPLVYSAAQGDIGREMCAALAGATQLANLTSLWVDSTCRDHVEQYPGAWIAVAALQGRHLSSLVELRVVRRWAGSQAAAQAARASLELITELAGATFMCPGLKVLQISGCGLGGRGAARLCAAIVATGCTHLAGLRELDLHSNGVGDVGAACFAAALAAGGTRLQRLRRLSLANNDITSGGMELLAEALAHARHLSQLEVLDLDGNPTADWQAAAALAAAPSRNPLLRNFQALCVWRWVSEGFPEQTDLQAFGSYWQ